MSWTEGSIVFAAIHRVNSSEWILIFEANLWARISPRLTARSMVFGWSPTISPASAVLRYARAALGGSIWTVVRRAPFHCWVWMFDWMQPARLELSGPRTNR